MHDYCAIRMSEVKLLLGDCLELMNVLSKRIPGVRIGIAGGLSGDNVFDTYTTIRSKVNYDFCIDAEGKLMDNRILNIEKMQKYLEEAYRAVETVYNIR